MPARKATPTGPRDESKTPFHSPFGGLGGLRDRLAKNERPAAAATPTAPAAARRVIPRAVIRLERSGRGGKVVTAVEQLPLEPTEREEWLKWLKVSLGTGGTIEGDALVMQGDQRGRLPVLLTARGVRKVTIG